MIGEMRDGETAQIAVQSATGHLVLSTLHRTAAGAIIRMQDMGVERYLIPPLQSMVCWPSGCAAPCADTAKSLTHRWSLPWCRALDWSGLYWHSESDALWGVSNVVVLASQGSHQHP